MGAPREPGGAVMTQGLPRAGVLVVRTAPLAVEEAAVLTTLRRKWAQQGKRVVEVLLGSASYDSEVPLEQAAPAVPSVRWVLEDDAKGRGLRLPPSPAVQVVSAVALVDAVMDAEVVVQLP